MLCLICHFNQKICNEREKQTFPPRGTTVSHEILTKYVTYGKDFFETVLTPP